MAELWAAQQRCSAPLALLQQHLGDAWAPIAAGVLERMVAEHGAGAQRLAMIALLSSGLKAGGATSCPDQRSKTHGIESPWRARRRSSQRTIRGVSSPAVVARASPATTSTA